MEFFNRELEGSVLSAVISNNTKERLSYLHEKLFYFDESKWLLEKLYNNPECKQAELVDLYRIERGSPSILLDMLMDGLMSAYRFDRMVGTLWTMYYKRNLQEMSLGINASLDTHDAKAIIQSCERRLAEMQKFQSLDTGSMNNARQAWLEEKEKTEYLKTSISELDKITGGIKGGRVWVIGGLPGSGKSFLGLQTSIFNVHNEKNCLFFSTELTKAENFDRLLKMQQFFFASKQSVEDDLANHPNFRLYDDQVSVTDIVFEARRQNRLQKVDLVVVDHIQDLDVSDQQNQFEAISRASSEFKRLAIENNIAVVLLSQLNKEGGFFGAAKLNQIAHCSITIERDEDSAMLIVQKNRSGNRGVANVSFKTPDCVFLGI